MPISSNLTLGNLGSRFAAAAALEPRTTLATAAARKPAPPAPAAPAPAIPATAAAAGARVAALNPAVIAALNPPISATFTPGVIGGIRLPDLVRPLAKTTTQLANGALSQLSNAAAPVVREAMTTAVNSNVAPTALMQHLERYTRVGEVLNDLAVRWTEATRGDFAKAFNTTADKTDVMDAIVSLAILNDGDLEAELRAENMPAPTDNDLMNRRIVWQSPPPGTPLEPPYVVVIAVEYTDVAKAEDVVKTITDQLVLRDRFKLPRTVAERL